MDVVTLLAEARAAGFKVSAQGDRLLVRGPLRLESLAHRVLAAKTEILAALKQDHDPVIPPLGRCPLCNGRLFWRHAHGRFICSRCHPCPCPEHVAEKVTIAAALPAGVLKLLGEHGWDTDYRIRWPQTLRPRVHDGEAGQVPSKVLAGAMATWPTSAPTCGELGRLFYGHEMSPHYTGRGENQS